MMSRAMPRSLRTYSCIHSRPPARLATSSRRVVDIVLRVYGTPSLAAARASATSPSRCSRPFKPVGAMTSGALAGWPRMVVR